jgi:hypothetical protein
MDRDNFHLPENFYDDDAARGLIDEEPMTKKLAEGVWCTECNFFYIDSDVDNTDECGHSSPTRVVACIMGEEDDDSYEDTPEEDAPLNPVSFPISPPTVSETSITEDVEL